MILVLLVLDICEGDQQLVVPDTLHQLPTSAPLHRIARGSDGGSLGEISEVLTTAADYLSCAGDLAGQEIDPQSYINGLWQVSPFSIIA